MDSCGLANTSWFVHQHLPEEPGRGPEHGARDLVSARSEEAGHPDHFAGVHLERHAAKGDAEHVLHFKDRGGDRRSARAGAQLHLVADDGVNEVGLGEFAGQPGGQYHPTVAQHGHPVGQAENFVEQVGDEDDADAASGGGPHGGEQGVDLAAIERSRRLVEDQDAPVAEAAQGPHNGHGHLLGRRQRTHGGAHVGHDAEVGQESLGVGDFATPPDAAQPRGGPGVAQAPCCPPRSAWGRGPGPGVPLGCGPIGRHGATGRRAIRRGGRRRRRRP